MLDLSKFEEKKEFALIKRVVKLGMFVVDIGAHIGYYTALFSELVGMNGKVYAFEPTPDIFLALKKNTPFPNVDHINYVVSSYASLIDNVPFYIFDEPFSSFNSLYRPNTKHQPLGVIKVESVTLDMYHLKGKVGYLKVDVEGGELDVFKGAYILLKNKQIDYIQFEISQAFLEGFMIKSHQFLI